MSRNRPMVSSTGSADCSSASRKANRNASRMSATRMSTTTSLPTAHSARTFARTLVSATLTVPLLKNSLPLCKSATQTRGYIETDSCSTVTRVTTEVDTVIFLVRNTPVTTQTVTVTQGQNGKRDAQITAMPRDASYVQKSDYINMFRRQADNSTELPPDDNVIAVSLSSACSCQAYIGTTVTETYTNQPNVSNNGSHLWSSTDVSSSSHYWGSHEALPLFTQLALTEKLPPPSLSPNRSSLLQLQPAPVVIYLL